MVNPNRPVTPPLPPQPGSPRSGGRIYSNGATALQPQNGVGATNSIDSISPMTSQDRAAWVDSLGRVRNLFTQLPNEKDVPVGQYVFSKTPSGAGVRVRESNASVPSAGLFYPLGSRMSVDDITFNNKRLASLTDTERSQAMQISNVTSLLTPQWISARSQMYSNPSPNLNQSATAYTPVGLVAAKPTASSKDPQSLVACLKGFSQQLAFIDEQTITSQGGFFNFKKTGAGMWSWEKPPGSMRFPVNSHLLPNGEVFGKITLNGIPLGETTEASRNAFLSLVKPDGGVLDGMVIEYKKAKGLLAPRPPSPKLQAEGLPARPQTMEDIFERRTHDALRVLRSHMTPGELIETGKYRIRRDKDGNFNIAPQGAPTPDDPPYLKIDRHCLNFDKEFLVNNEGFKTWPAGMQESAMRALLDVKSWLEVNRRET